MIAKFAIGKDLVADQLKLPQFYILRSRLQVCELPPISLVDVGYDVEQSLHVFMGLVTAAAMALALDAAYDWYF